LRLQQRVVAAGLSLFVATSGAHGQEAPAARAQSLIITNITIVDVTSGHLSPHMNVAVAGRRITAVSNKALNSSARATLDGTGMYLIPGLWDMHIHAFFTNDSTRFHATSDLMLPLFVANGVTGVRDMGSNLDAILAARDSVAAHQLIGPRMVVSGPMLDGPTSRYQVIIRIATAEDARAAVRKLKERGVDFIKTQSLVPRDAYFAVADASQREGIRFEGHVPYAIRGTEAIESGQHSFEHLLGVFEASTTREDSLITVGARSHSTYLALHDDAREAAIIAALGKHHVWQCPTIASDLNSATDLAADPGLPYWLHTAVDGWRRAAVRALNVTDTAELSVTRRYAVYDLDLVRKLHRAGAPILAGTDAPAGFDLVPGASIHRELEWLVAAGLTPLEALQTATINPANYLGRSGDLGTVAVGKLADLVILSRNPLTEIGNTRSIVAVVADGRYFPPNELSRMRLHLMELAAK
jgi:imidazolonepropionase-like amidohydrolase